MKVTIKKWKKQIHTHTLTSELNHLKDNQYKAKDSKIRTPFMRTKSNNTLTAKYAINTQTPNISNKIKHIFTNSKIYGVNVSVQNSGVKIEDLNSFIQLIENATQEIIKLKKQFTAQKDTKTTH